MRSTRRNFKWRCRRATLKDYSQSSIAKKTICSVDFFICWPIKIRPVMILSISKCWFPLKVLYHSKSFLYGRYTDTEPCLANYVFRDDRYLLFHFETECLYDLTHHKVYIVIFCLFFRNVIGHDIRVYSFNLNSILLSGVISRKSIHEWWRPYQSDIIFLNL